MVSRGGGSLRLLGSGTTLGLPVLPTLVSIHLNCVGARGCRGGGGGEGGGDGRSGRGEGNRHSSRGEIRGDQNVVRR
jgi:hypothetical protein